MTLAPEEVERYARHLVLSGVGGPGQSRLKSAHVAVIGVGGLGAPAIAYLAAAGVGTLTLIDNDTVSVANLQRQILFTAQQVGKAKVSAAEAFVTALNPHVSVERKRERLDSDNAGALIDGAHVVLNGTDNFASREALAEACENLRVPLVEGAVSAWDGHVTTLTPYATRADGRPWPRFSDLFERPSHPEADMCEQFGVLGVTTGVIGTLQAAEAVKLILGEGEPLLGRLLLYDGRSCRFEVIAY